MAGAPSTARIVEFQSEKLSELWYLSTQWIYFFFSQNVSSPALQTGSIS